MSPSRIKTRIGYACAGLAVGLLTAAVAWAMYAPPAQILPVEFVPEPESWGVPVGVPAPLAVATQPGHVEEVQRCRIPRFGLHPWRKSGEPMGKEWEAATRQALAMAYLPGPAVDQAIARLRNVEPDDIVLMSNTHGAGKGATYYPFFTTTYRHSTSGVRALCRDSMTNFGSDTRTETALVYRVQHAGKVYPVGIFMACNNVTVFEQAPAGWMPKAARPDVAQWVVPHPTQAHGAPLPGHGGYFAAPVMPGHSRTVNEVPEPGALLLVLSALAGMAVIRRRSRKP